MSLVHKLTGKPALFCDWDGGDLDISASVPRLTWVPGVGADPTSEAESTIQLAKERQVGAYVVDTASLLCRAILVTCPPKGRSEFPYDYSLAQTKFNQWAMKMFELTRAGIHVLWTFHEGVSEIKEAGGAVRETIGGPESHLGPKFLRSLPAISRLVFRIKVVPLSDGGVSRRLQTDTDGFYLAKDRLHAFPPGGVKIGVSPYESDAKTPKSAEKFENECLVKSEEVWTEVFEAASRRASAAKGE